MNASTDDPLSSDGAGDDPSQITVVREGATNVLAALSEAPAAFDNKSNDPAADPAGFEGALEGFRSQEQIADGLGPVFNAQSCGECHQTPVTGAASQVSELRAGHFDGTNFIDAPGGSLINERATDASIQERVPEVGFEVRTFRLSLNILGDGFVESIDSRTLLDLSNAQPAAQRGSFYQVPVKEAIGNNVDNPAPCVNNTTNCRGARFGWKNQHASLHDFAADAYVNEMGITSILEKKENTSMGNSTAAFDPKADPEDPTDADIGEFIEAMRGSKAPPRDTALAATTSATQGAARFNAIGCATCHVATHNTVPAGTAINGGALIVTAALGDKIIHPYSDFLMHNVGTGDGIVQNNGQVSRNQIRTPPLWGLRARSRLMHDGISVTLTDAIARHRVQGATAAAAFAALTTAQKQQVFDFLHSL